MTAFSESVFEDAALASRDRFVARVAWEPKIFLLGEPAKEQLVVEAAS